MKVKKLIEKLSLMNQNAEVKLNDYDGDPVLFVNARCNDSSIVWLDGEHDIDMREELSARYERVENKEINITDFFADLIDIGVTCDVVRKYMGDDIADCMNDFIDKIQKWKEMYKRNDVCMIHLMSSEEANELTKEEKDILIKWAGETE